MTLIYEATTIAAALTLLLTMLAFFVQSLILFLRGPKT